MYALTDIMKSILTEWLANAGSCIWTLNTIQGAKPIEFIIHNHCV